VGYNPPNPNAALIHYTLGGPYFNEYIDCEHADTWFKAKEAMLAVTQRDDSSAVA
jgi:hypothetical protein